MKRWVFVVALVCTAALAEDHAGTPVGGDNAQNGEKSHPAAPAEKKPGTLRAYGEGGNKSFDIRLPIQSLPGEKSKGQTFAECQATRILGKSCLLVTAAHCVEEYNGKAVEIETADFGKVQAKVTVHPEYAKAYEAGKGKDKVEKKPDGSIVIHGAVEKPFDIALLELDAKACEKAKKVEAQPLCEKSPKPGTTVYAASSHYGKLIAGSVRDPKDKLTAKELATQSSQSIATGTAAGSLLGGPAGGLASGLGAALGAVAQPTTVGAAPKKDWISVLLDNLGIKIGDSGGGLFAKVEPKSGEGQPAASAAATGQGEAKAKLCWAGALSGTPSRAPVGKGYHLDASYAADASLKWVKDTQAKIEQGKGGPRT
jgi:hypothetical protein